MFSPSVKKEENRNDRGLSRASAERTTVVSLFRINVRSSVQRKCHSVMPRWYQMMTPWDPRGIVALGDPRHPCRTA